MRKQRPDFSRRQKSKTVKWFDLYEDYALIEASFAEQYGIRLRREYDMPWDEFSTLLSGLNGDTPLGRVVFIRSTEDKEYIKTFDASQMRIRNDWRAREAQRLVKNNPDEVKKQLEELQAALAAAFSND